MRSQKYATHFLLKEFDSSYVINVILWSWHSFITKSTYFLIMYPKYNLMFYTSEWGNSSVNIVTKLGPERRRIRDQIATRKKQILLFSKSLVQVPQIIKPPIQRAMSLQNMWMYWNFLRCHSTSSNTWSMSFCCTLLSITHGDGKCTFQTLDMLKEATQQIRFDVWGNKMFIHLAGTLGIPQDTKRYRNIK